MRFILFRALLSLAAFTTPAVSAFATPLLERSFSFTLASGALTCTDGQLTGDYPSPTLVSFSTGSGTTALRAVVPGMGLTMLDINTVKLQHQSRTKTCAALSKFLKEAALKGNGTQVITEETSRQKSGECIRVLKETVRVTLQEYAFEGRARFIVSPANRSQCAP